MASLINVQRLFAIAFAITLAACGFGDDRTHFIGDDVVDPECGDGLIDPGEDCDDNDDNDGDGCDSDCEVEPGWNCTGEPSDCTMGQAACGDGAIANGEECDDDGTADGDGCDADCDIEPGWECHGSPSACNLLCGNGHVDPGEECDGGPTCDANCQDITPVDCTLVPQTGCTGTMACDLTGAEDGSTECRPVTGMGGADSLCNATDTVCSAGFTCVGVDVDTNVCARFCGLDSHCTGVGARCVVGLVNSTTGNPIPGVTVCSNACNPVTQTGCPAQTGCLPFNDDAGDFSDCLDMGTRNDGQSCSMSTECKAGSLCVGNPSGGSDCQHMCDLGGPDTCAGALTCGGFVDTVLIGGLDIGSCR